jgi:hypothetical protein
MNKIRLSGFSAHILMGIKQKIKCQFPEQFYITGMKQGAGKL